MKTGRPPTPNIPIGSKFGRWTVVAQTRKGKGSGAREAYVCACECGAKQVYRKSVLQGACAFECRSCASKRVRLKHGGWGRVLVPEYKLWTNMKQRCLNTKHKFYRHYGGRGITICARWLESFDNFYADMGPRTTALHTLERRDNNGNYAPENCYWATRKEQCNNQSSNRWVTVGDETRTLTGWAEALGTKRAVLANRIDQYGWDEVTACTTPVRTYRRKT